MTATEPFWSKQMFPAANGHCRSPMLSKGRPITTASAMSGAEAGRHDLLGEEFSALRVTTSFKRADDGLTFTAYVAIRWPEASFQSA